MLLVLAQALGLTVAVGDCPQASLQAPLLEKSDVWVTPPLEAEVQPRRAWRLLKTLPGLKGGPAAWSHHATSVKEERCGLIQSARDPCVHSNVRERMWTMRHMDDYVVVGPHAKVSELTEDMGPGTRQAAGEISGLDAGTVNGFRLLLNPQLIEDIVQDSGLANSTRKCATAGVKDRVIDETPLEREEHSYFRTQVGRLFLSVLRPDLQYSAGQLARHASAPTVSDRIALMRLIRFLSVTREMKLELFPIWQMLTGRVLLSADL